MIFNVGAGGGASTADKVKYDNTESGLQSDNVQGAVDELNSSLDDISSSLVKLKNQSVTFTNGFATFSHESIKTTSIIIVQPVSLNGTGSTAITIDVNEVVNSGSVTIKAYDAYNKTNYSGTILLNILICN